MHPIVPGCSSPRSPTAGSRTMLSATPAAISDQPAVVHPAPAGAPSPAWTRAIRISAISGDRDVDPEDRPPRPLGEEAAERGADRGQAAGDAEEERQRLAALAQLEGLHHDRERGREHDRAADALHARGTSRATPRRRCPSASARTAPTRPRRRSRRAITICRWPTRVGEAAAEGEERGQRQQVGVDRPLHAGGGQARAHAGCSARRSRRSSGR